MHILIIGTGYVGLVSGACFAEMGHHVICLDVDEKKIRMLQKGIIPIYEPGLQELVKRNTIQNRLHFTTDYQWAIDHTSVLFLAVPTPSNEDGSCDMRYIESAARQVGKSISSYRVIVNKSTVPVGTVDQVTNWIQEELKQRKTFVAFDVVSNPEFLKEGAAVQDCLRPDRIVIGTNSIKAEQTLRDIYAPFVLSHDKVIVMDPRSAEMTKYAANAMLATRISFINEMAGICKKVGANINEVRKGIGSDSRIGYSFLYPGIGYGGSCFPKDLRALAFIARQMGFDASLLDAVEQINIKQKKLLGNSIHEYFKYRGGLDKKVIAIWGLSFKPDTDDMREAPSLVLIEFLLQQGATLRLFDPVAMNNAKRMLPNLPNLIWCQSEFEAATGAHAIALLTEWKQFRLVEFEPIRKKMVGIAIFDGRNQYKPSDMRAKGFDYIAIGVPDQLQPFEMEEALV
jgi:UDPglucose 6-dehydrogenase